MADITISEGSKEWAVVMAMRGERVWNTAWPRYRGECYPAHYIAGCRIETGWYLAPPYTPPPRARLARTARRKRGVAETYWSDVPSDVH